MDKQSDNREMHSYTMDLIVNTSYTAYFDTRIDPDEVYCLMKEQAKRDLKNKDLYDFDELELEETDNFRRFD